MSIEVTGIIKTIYMATEGINKLGKPWKRQVFVIETQEQYPTTIAITILGDKVDDFENYLEGMEIKCSVNIKSNEFNDRWYTEITAWRFSGAAANSRPNRDNTSNLDHDDLGGGATDDLPF